MLWDPGIHGLGQHHHFFRSSESSLSSLMLSLWFKNNNHFLNQERMFQTRAAFQLWSVVALACSVLLPKRYFIPFLLFFTLSLLTPETLQMTKSFCKGCDENPHWRLPRYLLGADREQHRRRRRGWNWDWPCTGTRLARLVSEMQKV